MKKLTFLLAILVVLILLSASAGGKMRISANTLNFPVSTNPELDLEFL